MDRPRARLGTEHLFLTGFMGTGKTTVGRILARELGRPFVDLDGEIESRAGKPIAGIFAADGEEAFRQLEHESLKALEGRAPAVVATGGGLPAFRRNRRLMEKNGVSVWLDVPFAAIVARLDERERRQRPLFDDEDRALRLFQRRRPSYAEADIHLELAGEVSPEQAASLVLGRLGGKPCAT